MSVRFQCLGTAASGTTLYIFLTDSSIEYLTQNLDWTVVFEYPAIRTDGSWRYYSDSLPSFSIGQSSESSNTKVTWSLSRDIVHYAEQPRRVVNSGKLILNIYSLSKSKSFTLTIPDVWFTNSASFDVPVTRYLSESKVLFNITTSFANRGLEYGLQTVRYGNLTKQKDRDVDAFLAEHVTIDGPLV